MLKGCVIGLGAMGSRHVRVLHELQEEAKIELVGVADVIEERVKDVARNYGVDWFADYKILLKKKPDFAVVAVPTKLHYEVTLDTIKNGCHVLVEKPLASMLEEGEEIIETARKNRVQLMVGHIERFNPTIDVIKERIGKERVLLIGATRVGPLSSSKQIGIGVVRDLGVHDIDLIRFITGSEFKRIEAFTSVRDSGVELSSVLSFEMENGSLAYIITNVVTPLKMRKIEVTTTKKFLVGDLISQKVTEYSKGELISYAHRSAFVHEINLPYAEPLKLELKAFINSIRENRPPPVTGEDGLRAMEVAIKCLQSMQCR